MIYVKDASRSVGVCQQLVDAEARATPISRTSRRNTSGAASSIATKASKRRSCPCRRRGPRSSNSTGPRIRRQPPRFLGVRAFDDYPLDELLPYIDWMPFFNAWEFTGQVSRHFAAIRWSAKRRATCMPMRQRMLDQLIAEKWLKARAVVGFFPANSSGDDDIVVFVDDARDAPKVRLHHLRQQKAKPQNQAQSCLADFIAPMSSGRADYLGAFAVTAGIGIEEHVARFEAAHDDYSSIMLKALADRLAEALAERMHERVRRELWGYAPAERLDSDGLIREQYQGIRPAPGYPACPEHTEKATLWQLLDAERNAGIRLTESFAMLPTAAVSGFYFSHPQAHYFGVGQIDRDQVASYAQRKGWSLSRGGALARAESGL